MNEEIKEKLLSLAEELYNHEKYKWTGFLLCRILQRLSLCSDDQLDVIDDEMMDIINKWDD